MNIYEFAYRLGADKENTPAVDVVAEAVNYLSDTSLSPVTPLGTIGAVFLALAEALEVDPFDALEAVITALRVDASVHDEDEEDETYGSDYVESLPEDAIGLANDSWEREDAAEAARGRWNFWGADGAEGSDEF